MAETVFGIFRAKYSQGQLFGNHLKLKPNKHRIIQETDLTGIEPNRRTETKETNRRKWLLTNKNKN